MEEHVVWTTTRRIKPDTLAQFERARRPGTHPDGMPRAFAYWSDDEQQVIGVAFGLRSSPAMRGGHPRRKRADVRRWLPISSVSRKRSTEAAS
jgi:hypothetical protein